MNAKIVKLRARINKIDKAIIKKIAQRIILAQKIGKIKKDAGLKLVDRQREKKLSVLHAHWSREFGVDVGLIKHIFSEIMNKSKSKRKL